MKIKKFLILLFLVLPTFVFTKENFNIGLVKGLWLSDTNIFTNDKTFINTVFYNDSKFDIIGTVIFYDNNKEFFKQRIIVKSNKLQQIKAPYSAITGIHSFKAITNNVMKIENGKETEKIESINGSVLGSEKIKFDFDTDGDKIGNIEDLDDDGDGYSDIEEIENNSDPLDKNSIPENTNSTTSERIKTVIQEVKEASDNIFTRAETFRNNTADFLKDNIKIREKKTKTYKKKNNEIPLIDKTLTTIETSIESIKLLKKRQERTENTKDSDYYLIFLKFMYFIFNSIILSILFFIFVVWILYKLTKRIIFRNR